MLDFDRVASRADRRVAYALLRRLRSRLDEPPGACTIHHVVAVASTAGGVPIHVRALPRSQWLDDEPGEMLTGVALRRSGGHDHVILVRDDLDRPHRDHVIAHELAHLLLHRGVSGGLCTGAGAARGAGGLAASGERQAEAFANLVCTRLLGTVNLRDRVWHDWVG